MQCTKSTSLPKYLEQKHDMHNVGCVKDEKDDQFVK